MKKKTIIKCLIFQLKRQQSAVYMLLLFICVFNCSSLLAQTDKESVWKDVLETDELYIKYDPNVTYMYNTDKTKGAMYVGTNKDGWRGLGHTQRATVVGDATVLMVKSKKENQSNPALKSPIDYTLKWTGERADYYGTPKKDKYSFWVPVPPPGYVALGSVVYWNADKPPLDMVWCVRQDLTVPAQAGSEIMNTNNGKSYTIEPTNATSNPEEMHLTSGSFLPHNDEGPKFALKVQMTKVNYIDQSQPDFTPNMKINDKTAFKKVSCSYIPTITVTGFSGIGGGMMKRLGKTQLLQVVSYEAFKLCDLSSNNTTTEIEKEFSVTVGTEYETLKEITNSFSATLETQYSYGSETSVHKGSVSLSLSYGFSATNSTRNMASTSTTRTTKTKVASKHQMGAFKKIRKYEMYYKDASGNPQLLKTWEMTCEADYWHDRPITP